jgi:hypothetical protein
MSAMNPSTVSPSGSPPTAIRTCGSTELFANPTLYVPAGATGGTVATTKLMLPLEKSSLTVTWYFGGVAAPATGAVATRSAIATAVALKTRRARVRLRIASLPPRRLPPHSPDLETLIPEGPAANPQPLPRRRVVTGYGPLPWPRVSLAQELPKAPQTP